MLDRTAGRGRLRLTALATAALLACGGAPTALAQGDPPSTAPAPTETVTPSSSTPPPPVTTEPTPPPNTPVPTSNPVPPKELPPPPVLPPVPADEPGKTDEQAGQGSVDLKIDVRFDRRDYGLGEPLGITVTLHNAGDAPANQIRIAGDTYELHLTTGVDELSSRPSLAPGETKTFKLGAKAQWSSPRVALALRAYVLGVTDKTPNDNMSRAETNIFNNAGQVEGVLYEDRNGNGYADPGEGLAWQTLKLTGGPEFPQSQFSTGQDGRFWVRDVPAGTYKARFPGSYNSSQMTIKPGQVIVVKPGEGTNVALQTAPVLSRSLQVVGHSFDRSRYAKGDPISVSVTLKNRGTTPISELVAVCDPENDPATLDGTAAGWGDLRPDGAGVTIGAGETKTFTVTDTVPDVDYPTGRVYFACAFSVDGRNTGGPSTGFGAADPGLTVGADVTGTMGVATGRVLHNGGPVSGQLVKVVALNPANNRVLGQAQTYDGNWRIPNLPLGQVALKVIGSWKLAGSPQRIVNVVADQNVSADLDVVYGSETDPTVYAPDLKVSILFDKASYDISDLVQMTLKVENVGRGEQPARGSWQWEYDEQQPYFDGVALRDFYNEPIELWPGESKQITLTGKAKDYAQDFEKLRKIRYRIVVGAAYGEPDTKNNEATASADITWGTGSLSATVYGDLNLNGQMDAGEELANRKVGISGGRPWQPYPATTDASGRVRVTGLIAGHYYVQDHYDRETGWASAGSSTDVVVNPGDEGTALVRLVRPLSDRLTASMKFSQSSYAPHDRADITVSITNNTDKPQHVRAECGGSFGNFIGNDSAGWGPFIRGGPGVEVKVGATATIRVDAPLPAVSADYGYVMSSCSFGPELSYVNPTARAEAKVTGATQTFRGILVTGEYPNQQPVPDVKLVLLDPATHQPVVRTTTDAEGKWEFPDLAVGAYKPFLVGPWRVRQELYEEGEPFGNVRGREDPAWIWADPGPEVADPDLVVPDDHGNGPNTGPNGGPNGGPNHEANPGLTPVKKIKNTGALASTGVSVLGLVLFGVLLVLAGAAMRRKPARR